MDELELERTFLAKELPKEIEGADFVEIVDTYIPDGPEHSHLRLRKKGDKYSITKKNPIEDDVSEMMEYTIELTPEEYEALVGCSEKRVVKKRYFAKIDGFDAEVDVFEEGLAGLVLVDFEFSDVEEKNKFKMPESMLADVTPEEFIAGGMLAGKRYEDVEGELGKYKYKKINSEKNSDEKMLSHINTDDILFFVYTDPGACTNLRTGLVYYVDNKKELKEFEGLISDKLREIASTHSDKFMRLTGGLGNYGYANKRAVYLGYRDGERRDTIGLKFDGKEYVFSCQCPEAPYTNGREFPLDKYDKKSIWEEFDK